MHMYEGNKGRGQADQALCSVVPITLVRVFNIVIDSQYISMYFQQNSTNAVYLYHHNVCSI